MHITLLYVLHEKLSLLPPVHHDTDVELPLYKSLVMFDEPAHLS
jgi:hypothetical protein